MSQDDEYRQILRDEWVEFDANMRKPQTGLAVAGLLVCLPLGMLLPGAQGLFGLSSWTMATIFWPTAVSVLLATGGYRLLGFDSKIYRALDHLETASIQIACGAASLLSSTVSPTFWFFYLVHAMVIGFHPVSGLSQQWVIIAVPVGVAAISLAEEGPSARSALALTALILGLMVRDLAAGFRKRMSELIFGRMRTEKKLAELQIEAERARIARELHDGLAADLTAIAWRAEVSGEATASSDARGEFLAIAKRARAAIDDTKVVVWALREDAIDLGTLGAQVKTRCAELCGDRAHLVMELEGRGDTRVPGSMAVDLLRMAQESVRNALQHGAPRRVRVRLECGAKITLQVEDDGSGLTPNVETTNHNHGLRNLEQRAKEHCGVFDIERLEPGTRVTVTLPWLAGPDAA